MRILVTGGSGFLGSALARDLVRAGHDLWLPLRAQSQTERLGDVTDKVTIGRCTDEADLADFVRQAAAPIVLHTACSYGRKGETPVQITDANLRYGLLILQTLAEAGTPAVFVNTGTVLAPDLNSYALSKHQFAEWGRFFATRLGTGLRFVNVLLQHMYGPWDDGSKFTSFVIRSCLQNQPTLALTSGEQQRDFIYIDDIVAAFRTIIDKAETLDAVTDLEVGSGAVVSIRRFAETAHRLAELRTELQFGAIPYRPNEEMYCKADVRAMTALGWIPQIGLEEGLKRLIAAERPTTPP